MKGLYGLILIPSSVIYSRSQSQRTALHSNSCCDCFFSVLSLNVQIIYLCSVLLNFGFKWSKHDPMKQKPFG